jgi:hypothetical protein
MKIKNQKRGLAMAKSWKIYFKASLHVAALLRKNPDMSLAALQRKMRSRGISREMTILLWKSWNTKPHNLARTLQFRREKAAA